MSSDNAAPILSRADTVNLISSLRFQQGTVEEQAVMHLKLTRSDAAQREEIQFLGVQNSGLTEEVYSLRAAGMRDQAIIQRLTEERDALETEINGPAGYLVIQRQLLRQKDSLQVKAEKAEAESRRLQADNRRLREALGKHHEWHLRIGTVMVSPGPNPHGNDELIELDLTDAYSDSSLCEETIAAIQPPAPEPSGNTGELPVCATCNGERVIWSDRIGGDTVPCPDCSAAQPATEQPRIWRTRWEWAMSGTPAHSPVAPSEEAARHGTSGLVESTKSCKHPIVKNPRLQFSTDNGKTWIDEQAEREGK